MRHWLSLYSIACLGVDVVYSNDYLKDKYGSEAGTERDAEVVRGKPRETSRLPRYNLRNKLTWSAVILGIFMIVFWIPLSDSFTLVFSPVSPELREVGYKAGLNMHGEAVYLRANPKYVNANTLASYCPHDKEMVEYGCYDPNTNQMYILEISSADLKSIEYTTAAHETLHAIWQSLPPTQVAELSSELKALYDAKSSDTLTNDIKPYLQTEGSLPINEIHSFAGSELYNASLTTSLIKHYDQFFDTRTYSMEASSEFDRSIANKTTDINNTYDALDKEYSDISAYKTRYLDSIDAYMQTNLYYGDIVTYNKNVDAYNNNLGIYNAKVTAYKAKVDAYNLKRQSFIDIYSTLFPDNAIPVDAAK